MTTDAPRASAWLAALGATDAINRPRLTEIYRDPALIEERRQRLCAVLNRYLETFGDEPVRIFRAPGRINLRGMHVDTHGGWLNLMTHQREVIVVAAPSPEGFTHVVNTSETFTPLHIGLDALPGPEGRDWPEFIASADVAARIAAVPGHWRNYVEGAWLRARHAAPESDIGGLRMVVDSNLPQGAALSSSAALCIALLHAWFGWNEIQLDNDALIIAAQDAEWYTGSRCGTCDQAAIILGRPGVIVHASLYPKDFGTAGARTIALPETLRVLVINSFTKRSISGAEKVAYTLNRFAYSMAMEIFQQALREAGYSDETVAACGRLSNITPEALGGHPALYAVLRKIPEYISLADLRDRYVLPDLDREYQRYFGDVPSDMQPREIGLRGPLLFGIAESERARHFAAALESGDYGRAGRLMTIGHEGDRRIDRAGNAIQQRSDDAWLLECAERVLPVEECPGVYGASSAALDTLVDAALRHGALGASLTGAGIAGTVLALCRAEDARDIAAAVGAELAGEHYAHVAAMTVSRVNVQRDGAVMENRACAGAGEIMPL